MLHPSNLWLTIHESIAHPTELDRALGYEANYAGTSFLAPPSGVLNTTRLGPDVMTFMGNRTEVGGCATCGWDDEAVPAFEWPIIENGIFVNYQDDARAGCLDLPVHRHGPQPGVCLRPELGQHPVPADAETSA